ncbi:hypothetical protein L5515_001176 [Caenorhabditis briggsae]|uniref:Uncharacterized protein n=1 Tax=Caenorhabditis briggsae TaxID=6238 RepID=A0AAE9E0Q4_CAEBR|nr:hypothetical protein L5515_001176 [Caenorhabditis briggsae]
MELVMSRDILNQHPQLIICGMTSCKHLNLWLHLKVRVPENSIANISWLPETFYRRLRLSDFRLLLI